MDLAVNRRIRCGECGFLQFVSHVSHDISLKIKASMFRL